MWCLSLETALDVAVLKIYMLLLKCNWVIQRARYTICIRREREKSNGTRRYSKIENETEGNGEEWTRNAREDLGEIARLSDCSATLIKIFITGTSLLCMHDASRYSNVNFPSTSSCLRSYRTFSHFILNPQTKHAIFLFLCQIISWNIQIRDYWCLHSINDYVNNRISVVPNGKWEYLIIKHPSLKLL